MPLTANHCLHERAVTRVNRSASPSVLRMLTALSTILKVEPELPAAQFEVLEPVIGEETVRHGNQQGCYHLAWRTDELRQRLSSVLGDRLIQKGALAPGQAGGALTV